MKTRTAIVTGITGQDGFYLSEYLLNLGYKVIGIARRCSIDNHNEKILPLIGMNGFEIIEGDVTDAISMFSVIDKYKPDEFYNLAAQSHVATSFQQPILTFNINALGVLNILEAIRLYSKKTRFYQASTSEMFGKSVTYYDDGGNRFESSYNEDLHKSQLLFQDEHTPFAPQSPYAVSKVAAHNYVQLYRDAYNLHLSCGILFNHESEKRGKLFVTRKITKWIGDLSKHLKSSGGNCYDLLDFPKLKLGNLAAMRDWGYAKDYVRAMYAIVNHSTPDDYVVATGETHSISEFLNKALDIAFTTNRPPIEHFCLLDNEFVRPADVNYLCGNAQKINSKLGWCPEVDFNKLVKIMVDYDVSK